MCQREHNCVKDVLHIIILMVCDRVVSDECYPYVSGVTGTTSPCHYPPFKTLGSTAKCLHAKANSSLVFQASPPYRIAPNVCMWDILEM